MSDIDRKEGETLQGWHDRLQATKGRNEQDEVCRSRLLQSAKRELRRAATADTPFRPEQKSTAANRAATAEREACARLREDLGHHTAARLIRARAAVCLESAAD